MFGSSVLEYIIRAKHEGDAAKRAQGGLEKLKKAAMGLAAGFTAMKAAQAAVDLTKLGAQAQRQENALRGLASSAGESSLAIIRSIQGASDYTIDRLGAMQVANKALVMDVAKTPAEFERLTNVARRLGQAMGKDAASSIDDFMTAAARQSRMIADNLGLVVTAEDANKRYAESIGKMADELTDAEKKQAFLTEMLRQGEDKVEEMGDTTEDAATKIEQLETSW